ncbi:hypothetical protein EYB26_006456 [Talaromyces marneffei]|uniref:uncharacterized protein n=1 Tax=Talaromyces marneffei TaxID=37727 RepID=UPI0012A7D254|nr:uncharacterized protein EYB26_006456 [Talaromyces marneffei]QGA18771.1 hypothetical protein EYB26_006456 [Talaromyces marneffei]
MVYNFNLPTTSHLSFQNYIYSNTHPSLPQAASTARHTLRIALKTHKRLSPRERENNLQVVLNALNEYIPYLFTINDGLSGRGIKLAGHARGEEENIDITLKEEISVEWRPVLVFSLSSILKSAAATGAGNGDNRLRGHGIDFEIAFVVGTLGYVLSNMARATVLRVLYASTTPTADQKAAAMQNATRLLLQAGSAHTLLARSFTMSEEVATTQGNNVPQLNTTVQTALASLALAEATLLAILKDDAYTFACIQARNPNDKEWMVRAPEIPKMRALILARLCVRSAEHAEQALSGLGSVGANRNGGTIGDAAKIDEDLVKYVQNLIKVSRAKACRFFGIDAELSDKVGEAIAWLRAGKGALGMKRALVPEGQSAAGKTGAFSKLKKGWSDRRDERRLEKSSGNANLGSSGIIHGDELGRGDDAGWEEEARVIEMLEAKWVKMNNTINTQPIPPSEPLLSNLPSGRDIHSAPAAYKPPSLEESELIRMRAPPDEVDQSLSGLTMDNDSEDEVTPGSEKGLREGFPGSRSATVGSEYY